MTARMLAGIAGLIWAMGLQAGAPLKTMRVDYFHSGNAAAEEFSEDEVSVEGDWAGPLDRWMDTTNLGAYRFQVRDAKTKRPIYSRGYSSIFGEWRTTAEAKTARRTFSESLRFPMPDEPVEIRIEARDAGNGFVTVWEFPVDPKSGTVNRAGPPKGMRVWPVIQNGAPRDKVDLLLLGDGYTAAEMKKWHADARRFAATLFTQPPFKQRRSAFNVWAMDTPADESGVSIPSDGVWRRSPLRTAYDTFGQERYALAFDNKRFREIASAAPYEFVEIIMNSRKYGGGGIFNLYATVAADNATSAYVFVHEFGHHFAGLADEYYTSGVAYEKSEARVEPWEPNATADPQAAKWRDSILKTTPLPTPWPKQEYERMEAQVQASRGRIRKEHHDESEMERLFASELAQVEPLLSAPPYGRVVGAFEGANYEARGYFRPEENCIMFSRTEKRGFCAVCRRAIERVMDLYATVD